MNIFIWQLDAWSKLTRQRDRLAHALLIHGQQGIGKSVLARQYANSLLCQAPITGAGGFACGVCKACHWLGQGAHPDFLLIRPESVAEEEGGDVSDEAETRKSKRKPSKHIRIEQIRNMQETLATGSHQSGLRVIIIEPAEAMQSVTANALLKSLEEPPPDTLFLLVSDQANRLLPTIRSRCQLVSMAPPAREIALQWLQGQGVKDADMLLAFAGGAPLKAVALAEAGDLRREFARRMGEPRADALALTDFCQTLDPPTAVTWIQQWAYDLVCATMTGEVRYHAAQRERLIAIGAKLDMHKLHRFTCELCEALTLSRHPLNARLFFEAIFLSYRSLGASANE